MIDRKLYWYIQFLPLVAAVINYISLDVYLITHTNFVLQTTYYSIKQEYLYFTVL